MDLRVRLLAGAASLVLLLSACGGGGGGGSGPVTGTPPAGGTTPPPPPPTFEIANPYAAFGEASARNLGRLVVFGDSYSDLGLQVYTQNNVELWSRQLVDNADSGALSSYARSGERVADHLGTQVTSWANQGLAQGPNDLTVVYMGYNDVNTISEAGINSSTLDAYGRQANRLIDYGVTAGDRRLFVTLVHDWAQIPNELGNPDTDKRPRTLALNQGIVDLANQRNRVVAVDLFTLFERIAADPGAYGFTNITTADPSNSGSSALYVDNFHFGQRGQDIVANVFNHYLTRGWDWANSLQAGQQATARLEQDLDAGLIPLQVALADGAPLGFGAFAIGRPTMASGFAPDRGHATTPSRRQGLGFGPTESSGIGLNYAITPDRMFGIAITAQGEHGRIERDRASSSLSQRRDGVTLYVNERLKRLDLVTRATFGRDSHERSDHDGLIGRTDRARFGGRSLSLAQDIAYPVRIGDAWLRPWVGVDHHVQSVDGFTLANAYVSDVTYAPVTVAETRARLGLIAQPDAVLLPDGRLLRLSGSVYATRSLSRDDAQLVITEAAFGSRQEETIRRAQETRIGMRLGAALALAPGHSLDAGYDLLQSDLAGTAHAAMVSWRIGW